MTTALRSVGRALNEIALRLAVTALVLLALTIASLAALIIIAVVG